MIWRRHDPGSAALHIWSTLEATQAGADPGEDVGRWASKFEIPPAIIR